MIYTKAVRYLISLVLLLLLACKSVTQGTVQKKGLDLQAHRGGRGLMPENTIAAMRTDIDLGVTTLEMDAVISKDNKVVVSHDHYFNDLITTTPAGGFLTKQTAPAYLLYTMPYDSIRKFDVGMKPHPDFPRQQKVKAAKPLLSELIDSVEVHAKSLGREIKYNIEVKSKQSSDRVAHPEPAEFSELLIAVLKDKKILQRTSIQSFDVRPLQYIHAKYPSVALSYLVENTKAGVQEQLDKLGFVPNIYSPQYLGVTKEVVQKAHEKGMKVVPWTVNSVAAMNSLVAMDVDGMISDYPDLYAQLQQK
jgi:glycerophosphoryl diester phosphodiesterase